MRAGFGGGDQCIYPSAEGTIEVLLPTEGKDFLVTLTPEMFGGPLVCVWLARDLTITVVVRKRNGGMLAAPNTRLTDPREATPSLLWGDTYEEQTAEIFKYKAGIRPLPDPKGFSYVNISLEPNRDTKAGVYFFVYRSGQMSKAGSDFMPSEVPIETMLHMEMRTLFNIRSESK